MVRKKNCKRALSFVVHTTIKLISVNNVSTHGFFVTVHEYAKKTKTHGYVLWKLMFLKDGDKLFTWILFFFVILILPKKISVVKMT